MEEIIYKPIGIIHSPYTDVNDMPKSSDDRATTAELVVNKEYLESMADMKVGEEYMIIFHFHKSNGFEQSVPLRGVGPITGLFSTHAPNRPNAIGVSNVIIKEINGNVIKFAGVDMLDNTPVLDIKIL
jgi:tRNA-Thr(GGU) m(6)t(6)A37 methyltransferase TsaA